MNYVHVEGWNRKKKNLNKKWFESTQLTRKIHDSGYETVITSYKVNQNKPWNSIPSKLSNKWWNKKNLKKNLKNLKIKVKKSLALYYSLLQ
jgi:hypothetical protein